MYQRLKYRAKQARFCNSPFDPQHISSWEARLGHHRTHWQEKHALTCIKVNFSSRSMMMGKITRYREQRSALTPEQLSC